MIDRRHYGIIAFPTSQAAAAAEAIALAAGYACRLIPMPEQISAGCGLVLQTILAELSEIRMLLSGQNVSLDGCYEVRFENRKKFVTDWEG
jgi:hypothetical protein